MTLCFIEGHKRVSHRQLRIPYHLEGLHDHSHGDATSKVVQMPGHGIGRLRRALEALGFEVRTILPATEPEIPRACAVVIDANHAPLLAPARARRLRPT